MKKKKSIKNIEMKQEFILRKTRSDVITQLGKSHFIFPNNDYVNFLEFVNNLKVGDKIKIKKVI